MLGWRSGGSPAGFVAHASEIAMRVSESKGSFLTCMPPTISRAASGVLERRYNTPPSESELVYRIEAPRADRMPPVRPPLPEVDADTIGELYDLEADPDEHTNLAASP